MNFIIYFTTSQLGQFGIKKRAQRLVASVVYFWGCGFVFFGWDLWWVGLWVLGAWVVPYFAELSTLADFLFSGIISPALISAVLVKTGPISS